MTQKRKTKDFYDATLALLVQGEDPKSIFPHKNGSPNTRVYDAIRMAGYERMYVTSNERKFILGLRKDQQASADGNQR